MADLTQIQFNGVLYNLLDGNAVHRSDVDAEMSSTSENPVQNKAIYEETTSIKNIMPDGGVYFVTPGDSIAADTSSPYYASRWKGTNPKITSLFTGLTIAYKIEVAGNGTYGTVLDVNGLGEHPVVRNVNTMISTVYAVGSIIVLTYDADQVAAAYINSDSSSNITGSWKVADYDTNTHQTYYQNRYSGTVNVAPDAGTLYRYEYCMSNMAGELIPFNNVSNKNTTYTKAMNDTPFNPFGDIVYYYSTASVNQGGAAAASAIYMQRAADVRYSFNINSGGTAGTTALTAGEPVYLRALYNDATHLATFTQDLSSASYLERSSIVQSLPTAEVVAPEGYRYIYIYLGHAYSKYQMELHLNHQVYYWNNDINSIDVFGNGGAGLKLKVEDNGDDTFTANFYN